MRRETQRAYHIPGAVRIAAHGNPYFVDSAVDSRWYPAGAETLVAVFVRMTVGMPAGAGLTSARAGKDSTSPSFPVQIPACGRDFTVEIEGRWRLRRGAAV